MKNEYFWSIILEDGLVQAGIWTIRNEHVSIVSSGSPMKWSSEESLVEQADSALASAIQNFSEEEGGEPSRTVFGVPATWVEGGKITKDHLNKIRLLCSKLSLNPTGFVVLPEAIAHAIKMKDGSPLTGVVIGFGASNIDLSVFRLGNLVGTVTVGRSVSLAEDLIEGLSRFSTGQPVPTRWLLYNGADSELEKLRQELVKIDWKEEASQLRFLHAPQVEIVNQEAKNEAVSIAGASEIGEIVGVTGVANVTETQDLKVEDIGFVIDRDIDEEGPPSGEEEDFVPEAAKDQQSFSGAIPNMPIRFPKFHMPSMPRLAFPGFVEGRKTTKVLAVTVLGLVIATIAFGSAWWFLPKAEVAIFLSPKVLQASEVIMLDEGLDSPDMELLSFPATVEHADVSGSMTKQATGKKTVGEKAQGVVSIRNGTAADVQFRAGTILTGPGNLRYVTTETVSVPAALSPTTPGIVSVSAEAEAIGSDYNLEEDEIFSVANYSKSELDAIVEEEFSGGISNEVVAVSESDIANLRRDLLAELKSESVSELEAVTGSSRLVAESVEVEVTSEDFSHAAGDEVSEVSLSMSVRASGVAISRDQLDALAETLLREQVPDGFSFRSEQVTIDFEFVDKISAGVWEFDISLSANLLPLIDTSAIVSEIAGKHPQQVQEYLSAIPGYSRAAITIDPRFPGIFGNIPRNKKNIIVEVVAEQ